jgi:hypothetical protein
VERSERQFSLEQTNVQVSFDKLEQDFADRILYDENINRMMVSFQSNRTEPQFRWFKYREGFSKKLVEYLIHLKDQKPKLLLDPFAGAGTSLFTASNLGMNAVGIELLPVGAQVFRARQAMAVIGTNSLIATLRELIRQTPWTSHPASKAFEHLKITRAAFSEENETSISKFRAWAETTDRDLKEIVTLAALGILEEISYTRKDGQFLRWDKRAMRDRQGNFDKGEITNFDIAILRKFGDIIEDLAPDDSQLFPNEDLERYSGKMDLYEGDVFTELTRVADGSIDIVVTSPPYLNRYDYTRTYALELAYLGTSEIDIRALRQSLLTCTVENKPKNHAGLESWIEKANKIVDAVPELAALNEFFTTESEMGKLNNKGIATMVDGYFTDTALHLAQVAPKLKSGARYFMVNDNVRYNGLTIPVDLLLSKMAEATGFECEEIRVLPIGKGNSSQQMRDYGRSQIRKCVYVWKKI